MKLLKSQAIKLQRVSPSERAVLEKRAQELERQLVLRRFFSATDTLEAETRAKFIADRTISNTSVRRHYYGGCTGKSIY
ncbi:MAG: hypothetical protein AABX38_04795 [Candidatus Micrarchaeota archaeon]